MAKINNTLTPYFCSYVYQCSLIAQFQCIMRYRASADFTEFLKKSKTAAKWQLPCNNSFHFERRLRSYHDATMIPRHSSHCISSLTVKTCATVIGGLVSAMQARPHADRSKETQFYVLRSAPPLPTATFSPTTEIYSCGISSHRTSECPSHAAGGSGSFSVPLLEIGINISQISGSYLFHGI